MKNGKRKAFVSAGLMLTGFVSMLTGVILFLCEGGMIGMIPRRYLLDAHTISSFIMGGLLLLHIPLNAGIFRSEWLLFKKRK